MSEVPETEVTLRVKTRRGKRESPTKGEWTTGCHNKLKSTDRRVADL